MSALDEFIDELTHSILRWLGVGMIYLLLVLI